MASTGNTHLKPGKASDKAGDHSAKTILAAEKIARDKKTEKLRALRLERAAAEPPAAPPAPRPSRKASRS